jgi:hypothetical protein
MAKDNVVILPGKIPQTHYMAFLLLDFGLQFRYIGKGDL